MRRRTLLRLLPAALVGACTAGEIALPAPPAGASATAIQGGVRLTWDPVEGASRYLVVASTSENLTRANAQLVIEDAESPLSIGALSSTAWYFRIVAVRAGLRSAESPVISAAPVPVGTSGLVPLLLPMWTATNADPSAHFGYPAIGAGDVDRDGFDDILVGSMFTGSGGTAFLYRGGPDGPSLAPDWARASTMTGAHFGKGLSAGDIDGDGWIDLVVGAAEHQEAFANEGRAWVYRGTGDASFFEANDLWSQPGGQVNAFTGRFTAIAGDVNGDGRDDFVVERHALDSPQVNEGYIGVWYGTTGPIPAAADWEDEGDQADAFFGYALSPSRGDANGDGYDDLLAGAFQWDTADNDAGAAFLYPGGRGGLEPAPSWSAFGEDPSSLFGSSLAFAGDVNGDGFDDIVVGAHDFGADDRGKAYLFLGGPGGPSVEPAWTYEGTAINENVGMGVGAAGDVNADGWADVVVGAYNAAEGAPSAGRVDLFLGSATGLAAQPQWSWVNTRASEAAGGIAGSAGDVNGDGSDDLLVGVVSFEGFPVDNGHARLWLGPPASGPAFSLVPSLAGRTVTLTLGSASNPGASAMSCTLDWGDGEQDVSDCTGAPWSHEYAAGDTYEIRLRAGNAWGLFGETYAIVHVR